MKCRYCGNENPLGEKFCTSCGTPLVYHLGEKEEDSPVAEAKPAKEVVLEEVEVVGVSKDEEAHSVEEAPSSESLEEAAMVHGMDVNTLVEALNGAIEKAEA